MTGRQAFNGCFRGCFGPAVLSLLLIVLWGAGTALASGSPSGETTIAPSRLQDIVLEHIERCMPWSPEDVRVEFPGRITEMTLSVRPSDYRVDSRRNERYIGLTSFTVRFYDGSLALAEQSIRAKIEVEKEFVVTTRSLADGSLITADDVTIIRRLVDRVPRNRIGDPGQVTGKIIRGSIAPNTELQERMIREPQLVRRGESVRVVLTRGGLHMETMGVSVEAGARGDRIRVRNAVSNNLFYARVIDEAVVRVEY